MRAQGNRGMASTVAGWYRMTGQSMFVEERYPASSNTNTVSTTPAVVDGQANGGSLRHALVKFPPSQHLPTDSTLTCAWNSQVDDLVDNIFENGLSDAQLSTSSPVFSHHFHPSEALQALQDETFNSKTTDATWNNSCDDMPITWHQSLPQCQGSQYTTVMVRHLPRKYVPSQLMWELDQAGFAHQYDYVYIPAGSRRHQNRGYAFINFCSQAMAESFRRCFHDGFCVLFSSTRPLEVVPADIQGWANNFQHQMGAPPAPSHVASMSPVFFQPTSYGPR